ncbi:MAG TPA: hypothetical protein VHL80_02630 [Polyangia bacterium]|nr:hypothetical protein [Polyangia bacterium]
MAPDEGPPGEAPRPELGDAPPFWTWPRIYLFVVAALAAQVILFAALTAAYR